MSFLYGAHSAPLRFIRGLGLMELYFYGFSAVIGKIYMQNGDTYRNALNLRINLFLGSVSPKCFQAMDLTGSLFLVFWLYLFVLVHIIYI